MRSLMPDQIFISYAHADGEWLEEFRKMLAPAASKGLVDPWSDERIQSGDDWQAKIRDALARARVALLLVTAEFLSSPFIQEKELRSILAAANDGALQIYWVPVSESLFEYTDLGKIQAASDPKQPLARLGPAERRNAVAEICRKILDGLGQLPVVTRDDRAVLRDKVSERLSEKYQLLEELGTGATSIVFKARDKEFQRTVAVKTLVGSALQPQSRALFQKQIEVAYTLTSPAYLRIFDHFLDDWPQAVVSEYVEGCGLCRYLELANGVPPRRAKAMLVDLASALAEAHAKGYLHAGLMPSSVYIDVSQRPRISAFRFMNLAPDAGRWGTFLVNHETCTNLSPEQFYGHGRTQLSDQYALGLIGRELLTGKSIAPINCPADFVKRPQVFEELASEAIGGASTGLAGIVSRMLRVDPTERWASMAEVVEVLNDVVVYDTDTDRLRRKVVASYSELQIGDGGKRFYQALYRHLFALIPAARGYFSEEQLARQYAALNPALKLLLDYNPAKPQSVGAIREIARHHARLPLSGQHIDAFLKALLLALAEVGQAADLVDAWQQTMAPGLDEMRRVLDSHAAPQSLSGSDALPERTQSQLASA